MTKDTTKFVINADVQCFSESDSPGCTQTHLDTWEALNGIFKKSFEKQSLPFAGSASRWQDGCGHSCITYKTPFVDPSDLEGLVQEFANVVEATKAEDGAQPHLKEADVYFEFQETGEIKLCIATPNDHKFGGELVSPTPSAE